LLLFAIETSQERALFYENSYELRHHIK
jgi:hypothetical protein